MDTKRPESGTEHFTLTGFVTAGDAFVVQHKGLLWDVDALSIGVLPTLTSMVPKKSADA